MGSFSDFLELEILDHVFGNASYSAPATIYAAAYTTAPTDSTAGTEVANSNNYSRVAITNNATNFPAAAAGAKSNGTAITFPTASGSWGTVVAVALLDSATHGAGNILGYDDFTGVAISTNDTLNIPIGDLDITLD